MPNIEESRNTSSVTSSPIPTEVSDPSTSDSSRPAPAPPADQILILNASLDRYDSATGSLISSDLGESYVDRCFSLVDRVPELIDPGHFNSDFSAFVCPSSDGRSLEIFTSEGNEIAYTLPNDFSASVRFVVAGFVGDTPVGLTDDNQVINGNTGGEFNPVAPLPDITRAAYAGYFLTMGSGPSGEAVVRVDGIGPCMPDPATYGLLCTANGGGLSVLDAAGTEAEALDEATCGALLGATAAEYLCANSTSDGRSQIARVDRGSEAVIGLVTPASDYELKAAVFSADGNQIAFTAVRDRETSLFVIPVDGGEPRQVPLVNGGGDLAWYSPAPSPSPSTDTPGD